MFEVQKARVARQARLNSHPERESEGFRCAAER